MNAINDDLSLYCIGLVIYTFEDLLKRGKSLSVLIRRIRQVFPELDLDQVTVQHVDLKSMDNVDNGEFQSGLENGQFARFQIISSPSDEEKPSGLIRASLNSIPVNPNEPNYIFFSLPADYYQENIESVHTRLITIGREGFDFLNGEYGFAHLGFLSLQDEGSRSPFINSLAIPPFDFRDLYIPANLREEIPYLFWANWISRSHVDRLGGLENIQSAIPKVRVDKMSRGALLITSFPTPLTKKDEISVDDLNSLASFLVAVQEEIIDDQNGATKTAEQKVVNIDKNSEEQVLDENNAQLSVALNRMAWHVKKFEQDYLQNNKAPRNYVWRPYRFCTQDIVLGLTVVRHSVDNNCLEVDVCLTTELPEFEEGSSARVMWSFLLSEAFKCGGTMEIRFSEFVEGRHIPHNLVSFAQNLGAEFGHAEEGRITPTEARRVYLAITQFNPQLKEKILFLAKNGSLSPERACYAVHRGLWTQPELTQIVLSTPHAESILSGEIHPEHRLLFTDVIAHARDAILGGFLDRKLLKRVRNEKQEIVEREDDVLPLQIDYEPTFSAKVYYCPESFHLPWLAVGQSNIPVAQSCPFIVLIRACYREELDLRIESDLQLAFNISSNLPPAYNGGRVALLVPRDFEDIPPKRQIKLIEQAEKQATPILVCPETVTALDTEAARRFTSSRIIRE